MFLFLSFIISLFSAKRIIKQKDDVFISILIPCYNEQKNIRNCLKSIEKTFYDKKLLEVIIIDDGSTDKTADIANSYLKTSNLDIKLIKGTHQGKSMALNLGLDNAKHEIIMAIDADILLEKETIKKLVSPMSNKNVGATNAVAVIQNPKSLIEYFQMIEFSLNNLIRISFSKTFDNSVWFFGAVACYKKSVLNKIGRFKTDTLTEDMDICLELYNNKFKIITVPDARIATVAMPSVRALFKQRMRWYYGALQSLFKNRNLVQKEFQSLPIIFLFFNQYWWTFFAFVFFPMTAYQIHYWWPQKTIEAIFYVFRWFSISGPFYVLYKLPDWGLNFLNIFGVLSGIITLIMSISAIIIYKAKINYKTVLCLFFYFPYTIIQDAIIVLGVLKYISKKKKYFID